MLKLDFRDLSIVLPNGVVYPLKRNGDCLEATKSLNSKGYAQATIFKKHYYLHRLVLTNKLGRDIKPDHCACHSCDNRKCLNPNHLWEGTNDDNSKDMLNKGRHKTKPLTGSSNGSSKLQESDIAEIKELCSIGFTRRQVASRYGVSYVSINNIVNGKTWSHVKEVSDVG